MQKSKLSQRNINQLENGDTASKWESKDVNSASLRREYILLSA